MSKTSKVLKKFFRGVAVNFGANQDVREIAIGSHWALYPDNPFDPIEIIVEAVGNGYVLYTYSRSGGRSSAPVGDFNRIWAPYKGTSLEEQTGAE